ncbi:BRCA1 protein [Dictyocaulus viviparus]|uniref:BRCA1 protein n=1 Tax=Dictyocaulus viviparus TaxID=29172 RepID=A0A0D8Y0K5_DICVI|nr:BRCA1 protein [Dictyocaulus viviparus]
MLDYQLRKSGGKSRTLNFLHNTRGLEVLSMEAEIGSGDSEGNTSGILSRKGLFGKSGAVNETFEANVSTEQNPVLFTNDKCSKNHEGADISTSSIALKVSGSSVEQVLMSEERHVSEDVKDEAQHTCPASAEEFDESHHIVSSESSSGLNHQGSVLFWRRIVCETFGFLDQHTGDETILEDPEKSQNVALKDGDDAIENCSEERKNSPHDVPSAVEDGTELPCSVEEICVKKIISMDTDNSEEDQHGLAHVPQAEQEEKHIVEIENVTVVPENSLEEEMKENSVVMEEHCLEKTNISEDTSQESCLRNEERDIVDQDIKEADNIQVDEDPIIEKEVVDNVDGENIEEIRTDFCINTETIEKIEVPDDVMELRANVSASKETRDEMEVQESVDLETELFMRKETTDEVVDQNVAEEKTDVPIVETIEKVGDQNIEKAELHAPKRRSSARRVSNISSVEKKTPARDDALEKRVKTISSKEKNEEKECASEEVMNDGDGENTAVVVNEEENMSQQKSLRSRSRRIIVKEEVKKESSTPSLKKKRNVRLSVDAENEKPDKNGQESRDDDQGKEESTEVDTSRRSLRRKSARTPTKTKTPKSDTRSSRSLKEKSKGNIDKESPVVVRAAETPRRVKDSSRKSDKSVKTVSKKEKEEKKESHDPYDIDTEIEKHPEPLKNIQMEVQSFGEVKYAKVGSGKYERTEKTAELRVGNLAVMTPKAKQRRSLADLTPGRKKVGLAVANPSTVPQIRGSRKLKRNEEAPMEVGDSTIEDSARKKKTDIGTPKSGARSSVKRRASPQTPTLPNKRPHISLPEMSAENLLAVDHPHDEHAPYEPGARVYAMFDGLFYPAIVVSRDGLGRFKVNFVEDNVIKDVPPAGVIPLRALSGDKECYFADSDQKDRVAAKIINCPNSKSAVAWQNAEFELEQLNDDGDPSGKKFKAKWTKLALSKDDWKDYINRKSREATDVITDNIENSGDRQLRRSKATPSSKIATPVASKSTQKIHKLTGKSSSFSKSASKNKVDNEQGTNEEQIFAGKLFILTSANRPNADTGFKKKFMTDFITTHGGLVVDDMKEVDEHPTMERFLVSDTHYRTHKYLAALVRAMPCVSHEWIYKCLNEKKLVDYKPFLLPSGVSILDEKEYPLPTERGVLLRNKKVMVHSNVMPPSKKSMSFEQIWVPMVPQLGGEIVSDIPDEEGKLDILLTDHSATASMVEKARKIGCAVVSSEWLIQGIIMDRLPDVNAHQKFLHNGGYNMQHLVLDDSFERAILARVVDLCNKTPAVQNVSQHL